MRGAVAAAGGWEPLAARLGVETQTLRKWLRENAMPIKQAKRIERLYNVRIRANRKDHGGLELLRRAMREGLDPYALRRRLHVSDRTFRAWLSQGYVPPRRAQEIEKILQTWVDIRNRT